MSLARTGLVVLILELKTLPQKMQNAGQLKKFPSESCEVEDSKLNETDLVIFLLGE